MRAALSDLQLSPDARMRLKFTKMQGVGNDFVVVDAIRQPLRLEPATARQLADRHFGVGCDQMLVVERPRSAGTDFYYRIFNADGGEVSSAATARAASCASCTTRGLTDKTAIRVETLSGRDRAAAGSRRPGHGGHGRAGIRARRDSLRCADRRAPTYRLDVGGQPCRN